MASFADTVRFCFPTASSSANGTRYRGSEELSLQDRRRAPDAWIEEDDLGKDTAKFSLAGIFKSYAPDWMLVVLLWVVYAILNRSGGHKREFSLNDISIQHTFAEHERVPPNLLFFISAGIPLLVLVPVSAFVARTGWDMHNAVVGVFMSYTMTGTVTQLIKMSVGRPRPDLLARCLPREGSADHVFFGLSTVDICTTTNQLRLDDGFKSFPSGHSSLSFAGLGFLSCYLAGKMHLWDRRGHRTRGWFALSPLLGAVMVAISRTEDNRHHWQDVLVGSLLGLFIAWVSYRTYFPPLSHRQCHLPLAPRSPDTIGVVEGDEEMGRNGTRVRLLEEEEEQAQSRPSEEQVTWRRG
ncbi:phospholipid metabolism-related protein [Kockovaella imperatae]|uniref:Phospholipid metabolism-related protein n=1 Tax=Kockovaella imperatae TaxID=4999 RepID=A0A1Y1UUA3_9TREE|nr:phospholipid metabolism-related protein [Kockovaella imperatae]ORX41134.1 phospholipid metabolism-related protein [Kockovaella imperatae]